jgi:DNA repair photolyase
MKGRGVASNRTPRFRDHALDATAAYVDAPADADAEPSRNPQTRLLVDASRSIIAYNRSPDVPFSRSINPYRGCEHGCVYCFARPSHAWLDLSPGLDFETRILVKPEAARLLREELGRPGYRPEAIHLGSNTDPYQPVERETRLTRSILETLLEVRHPVTVLTKGALVERDADVLAELAKLGLARAAISITTLDPDLKRTLEPRAASAVARLRAIRTLTDAGVPTAVMVAPVIPRVNDHEIEAILEAAAGAGATRAGWILLRLPLELRELMQEWLDEHRPLAAAHVMSLLRASRGGNDDEHAFHRRMSGTGPFAALLEQRFRGAARRLGLASGDGEPLDCSQFRRPSAGGQLTLL